VSPVKVLLAGWYSFEQMGASAGDLLVRDVVGGWLTEAGIPYDVAVAEPFLGGLDWRQADPRQYTHLLFACGPLGNGWPVIDLFERYCDCRLVGLDVSMIESLAVWNPFDLLIERDSDRAARPDLAFAAENPLLPLCGVVQVHPQKEYSQGMHEAADVAIRDLLASREVAPVPIDTRLDINTTGLRSAAQVESLIARMDVVVTTRLHGLVLALKHGVPALAIDPIPKGAKVRRQAVTLGWPLVFVADQLDWTRLQEAFDHCLTEAARVEARKCQQRALAAVRDVQERLLGWLQGE
jgi:hypothetical protein